jgi:hypothetical protein
MRCFSWAVAIARTYLIQIKKTRQIVIGLFFTPYRNHHGGYGWKTVRMSVLCQIAKQTMRVSSSYS